MKVATPGPLPGDANGGSPEGGDAVVLSGGEGNGETERRENRENSVPAAEAATEAAIGANGSGTPPPARVSPGDDLGSSCEHRDTTVVAAAARKPSRSTERRKNRENSVPAAEAATEAAIVANGSGTPPPARVSPGDDLGSSCEHRDTPVMESQKDRFEIDLVNDVVNVAFLLGRGARAGN